MKVILETALLDDNQKATACALAKLAGADFVKTSTGFGPSGATAHDVALMRLVVGPDIMRTFHDFGTLGFSADNNGVISSVDSPPASTAGRASC